MLKVILWIITGLVVVAGLAFIGDTLNRRSVQNASIRSVDFSQLPDGICEGEYKRGRWSNKVRVTVASGKVTGIEVVRDIWFRRPELTEQVVSDVIKSQSLEVDIVSGATVTTRAYLKAMENALIEAR